MNFFFFSLCLLKMDTFVDNEDARFSDGKELEKSYDTFRKFVRESIVLSDEEKKADYEFLKEEFIRLFKVRFGKDWEGMIHCYCLDLAMELY